MRAQQNLIAAYTSWEQLTQAEGAAIQQDDWSRVRECQSGKSGLQKEIIHLTEAAHAECIHAGQDPKQFECEVRRIINSLISLESRNSELLAARQQVAGQHRADLDLASHNLRRVHKSYAGPATTAWNSYS